MSWRRMQTSVRARMVVFWSDICITQQSIHFYAIARNFWLSRGEELLKTPNVLSINLKCWFSVITLKLESLKPGYLVVQGNIYSVGQLECFKNNNIFQFLPTVRVIHNAGPCSGCKMPKYDMQQVFVPVASELGTSKLTKRLIFENTFSLTRFWNIKPKTAAHFINQPSGRAVTQPSHLPWSSGDDFRLSLTPISAGDRGSIPRGRDFFFAFLFSSIAHHH